MAANRWRLGCESLEDAGPEMSHELKSRIQPKIGSPRIMIFQKSKTIVAPTITELGIAADGALALRPLSEHGSCHPRVYIHVPTILTEKGLCVTHCLCENKLHSESTPGPALAAGYFLLASCRPGQAQNRLGICRLR